MRPENIISTSEIIRKKFLLQILLISIIVLSLFAFLSNVYGFFFIKNYTGDNPSITGIALLFFCTLLYLSKKTKLTYVGYIFVFLLFILNVFVSLQLGFDLPTSLLFYSLIIVIAGMLLSSRIGIFISIASACVIFTISYLQVNGLYHINEYWKHTPINLQDTIIYAVMLGVISVFSWLSNREIEKSLQRARESEAALQLERDKLEEMVEQRTAQLQQTQIEKMAQLYRFIEFGKLAGGLFHDFMTPLNLVSLNLENIKEESKEPYKDKVVNIQKYLRHAMYGTKRLEKFIAVARKQLHDTNTLQTFSLTRETEQVIKLFTYQAKLAKVTIHFEYNQDIKYHGNQHKISQIITNLLSNALDSYNNMNIKNRCINIVLYKKIKMIIFTISDNGGGMMKKDINRIFDPLYTTKPNSQHMGLGLYLIKGIIQDDLGGTISVKSRLNKGSIFSVSFPIKRI